MTRKMAVLFFLLLLIIPLLCFGQTGKKASSKVSFDFMDADVRNVVRILAEVSVKEYHYFRCGQRQDYDEAR